MAQIESNLTGDIKTIEFEVNGDIDTGVSLIDGGDACGTIGYL